MKGGCHRKASDLHVAMRIPKSFGTPPLAAPKLRTPGAGLSLRHRDDAGTAAMNFDESQCSENMLKEHNFN
jgi:hypothetical protein